MNIVLQIIYTVLVLGALIFIHELGHFLAARAVRIEILEFSLGMGPKLLQKVSKKSGTAYTLRLLPIGGFVRMAGGAEIVIQFPSLSRPVFLGGLRLHGHK